MMTLACVKLAHKTSQTMHDEDAVARVNLIGDMSVLIQGNVCWSSLKRGKLRAP